MITLDRKYRAQGFVTLGLSSENASTQQQFAQRQTVSYPLLVVSRYLPQPYAGVRGLPTTLIIDKRGKLRHAIVGAQSQAIESAVATLLQES